MTDVTTTAYGARPQDWFRELGRFLLRLALWVLGIYIVWRVRGIIADAVVAVIIAVSLVRMVDLLCKIPIKRVTYRTRRLVATIIVFVAVIALIVEGVTLIIQPFEQSWNALRHALPQHEARVMHWIAAAKQWYATLPPGIRAYLSHQGSGSPGGPNAAGWLSRILGGAFAGIAKIVDIVVLPVLSFYFVMDGRALRNEFLALLPKPRRREAIVLLREASTIMYTFVVAQFWLCVIAGVVVYIGLKWIGLGQYAPVLGLLAGVTRAIPIIGPVIGGIPIIAISLIVGGQNGQDAVIVALKVLAFFSILHLVESKLIMPKFIGHRIHLHAALVILVLLIGYEFFGLLGMFLAAPAAAFCRVLILHYVIKPRLHARQAGAPAPARSAPLFIKAE
jgi:predicted PurR-regulated permease PerM